MYRFINLSYCRQNPPLRSQSSLLFTVAYCLPSPGTFSASPTLLNALDFDAHSILFSNIAIALTQNTFKDQ